MRWRKVSALRLSVGCWDTNIKTTQIYAKVTDDMLAKGFDEMAGIYADKYSLAQ